MEILPGIHRLEADLQGRTLATYWIQGKNQAILIDTGLNHHPETILASYLKKHSLSIASLKEVYISHSDFDHFGGNLSLQKMAPEATFYAHPHDLPEVIDPILMIQRYRQFEAKDQIVEPSEVYDTIRSVVQTHRQVFPLKESRMIEVDDQPWEILETPGHTQGHISVYHPQSQVAIIQDAILGSGLLDSCGNPVFAPTYRSAADYRKTLEKIKSLSLKVLLTSHYPVFQGEEVDRFINESILFCDLMEEQILAVLQDRKRCSVKALISILAPIVGRWNQSAWNTLAWPLVGHLEDLKMRGIIGSEIHENSTVWLHY